MKDSDLKRNASGYVDEPCYKARTAPPKAGEIWRHDTTGAYMLVVANKNGVCSTLRLIEYEREDSITVNCKTPMYTAPIMLGYCFENLLTQYVKNVSAGEFAEVQREVGKVLGIPAADTHDLEEQVKSLTDENDGLKKSYTDVFAENGRLRIELEARNMACDALDANCTTMCAELEKANVYKEMYLTLLDKLVSARGAAND